MYASIFLPVKERRRSLCRATTRDERLPLQFKPLPVPSHLTVSLAGVRFFAFFALSVRCKNRVGCSWRLESGCD